MSECGSSVESAGLRFNLSHTATTTIIIRTTTAATSPAITTTATFTSTITFFQ